MRFALVLTVLTLAACRGPTASDLPLLELTGIAVAGPTCPVVRDPPDPACDDRPVAGATLVVTDQAGTEVARIDTDADGRFAVVLAPGTYRLVPQPVEGLLGTATPVEVSLVPGTDPERIVLAYDTGIR
jgi:hypothetical protein